MRMLRVESFFARGSSHGVATMSIQSILQKEFATEQKILPNILSRDYPDIGWSSLGAINDEPVPK